MDWTAAGVIVAMLGVVASLTLTIRGQHQERRIAEATASRNEAAARLTADNTLRVVEALEAMATRGIPGATVVPAPKVSWSLVHGAGDTYRLTNNGAATARSVTVSAHESLWISEPDGGPDLSEGEALTFMAAPDFGTSDMTITVGWVNGDGTEGHWRYPLPARPPR